MGPRHPFALLHSFSEGNLTLSPLTNAIPSLVQRTRLLASTAGAKLKIFFKGVFLEQWKFVGLEGKADKTGEIRSCPRPRLGT